MRLSRRLPKPWGTLLDWLFTIAIPVLFIPPFETEGANAYRIPSASMEPTLHCARPTSGCLGSFSDRVIAAKIVYLFRDPSRGEVAVFNAPARARRLCATDGGTFVKRVIGLPGEVVSERDGRFSVDGRALAEPYVAAADRDGVTATWPRIPAHEYFVMGDNRANSCDSRTWGPVPRASFIGPVVFKYWPLPRIGVP